MIARSKSRRAGLLCRLAIGADHTINAGPSMHVMPGDITAATRLTTINQSSACAVMIDLGARALLIFMLNEAFSCNRYVRLPSNIGRNHNERYQPFANITIICITQSSFFKCFSSAVKNSR